MILGSEAARLAFASNRGKDTLILKVRRTDLVGSAGYGLLGDDQAGADEPDKAVARNAERRRSLMLGQPFAILLRGRPPPI